LECNVSNSAVSEAVVSWSLNVLHGLQWTDPKFDLQDSEVSDAEQLTLSFVDPDQNVYQAVVSIREILFAKQHGRWISLSSQTKTKTKGFEIWIVLFNIACETELVRFIVDMKPLLEADASARNATKAEGNKQPGTGLSLKSGKVSGPTLKGSSLHIHVMDSLGVNATSMDAKYVVLVELSETGHDQKSKVLSSVSSKACSSKRHLAWDEAISLELPTNLVNSATAAHTAKLSVKLCFVNSVKLSASEDLLCLGVYDFVLRDLVNSLKKVGARRKDYVVELTSSPWSNAEETALTESVALGIRSPKVTRLRFGLLLLTEDIRETADGIKAAEAFLSSASSSQSAHAVKPTLLAHKGNSDRLRSALSQLEQQTAQTEATLATERVVKEPLDSSIRSLQDEIDGVEKDMKDLAVAVGDGGLVPAATTEDVDDFDCEKYGIDTDCFILSPRPESERRSSDSISEIMKIADLLRNRTRKLLNSIDPLLNIARESQHDRPSGKVGFNDVSDPRAKKLVRLKEILTGVLEKIRIYRKRAREVSDALYGRISGCKSNAEISSIAQLLNGDCYR
jgi:hypothetical protein